MPASGVSDAGSALSGLPSGATSGRARGRAEGTTMCASASLVEPPESSPFAAPSGLGGVASSGSAVGLGFVSVWGVCAWYQHRSHAVG